MHSSPADLAGDDEIKAFCLLNFYREPVQSLFSASLPSATTPSRKPIKRVLLHTDDNSAARPDGMLILNLKFLVRACIRETRENSGLLALYGFVCPLEEGGVSKEAAKFHS